MSPWKLHNGSQTLDNLNPGCHAAVWEVPELAKDGLRLQELGLVPGADVEVLCSGETMLVRVGDERLSLRREAACGIQVLPLD